MVKHCSFLWMKAHATKSTALGGAIWDRGAEVLIKGTNGRWRDVLTPEDVDRYEKTAQARRRLANHPWADPPSYRQ